MGRIERREDGTRPLTLAEALVGGAVLAIGALAWAALALAHARRYSLPAAAVLAAVLLVAVALVVTRHPVRVVLDRHQLLATLAVGLLTAALALPGFPVGMAGWDPGIYTNHAFAIDRTGAYDLPDPVLDRDPPLPDGGDLLNARFPGTSYSGRNDGRAVPGFYHLYPALLAPAAGVGGARAVVSVNPLLAVLAACSLLLVAWRAFGPLAGWLAGLLTAVNLVQVWHARFPTAEMLSQLLFVAALLGGLVAWQRGWRPAAGAAGVCTGLVFLTRADGLVPVGLAMVGLAALAAARRFGPRAWWFAGGLALTLPHGLAQAYGFAHHYTEHQGLPAPPTLALGTGALVAAALMAARAETGPAALPRRAVAALSDPRRQRLAGTLFVAAFVVFLGFQYLRPLLVDAEPDLSGAHSPYYHARSLLRLTWMLTPLGLAAVVAGVAVLALRRWRFSAWLPVLPTLLLLPLYLQNPRIGPRLIWWTRRFVPFAMPGLVVLVAVALVAGLCWRGRARIPVRALAGAAAVGLVGWQLTMSLPLRSHHEFDGSFAVHDAVVAAAGEDDVVWLWSTAAGDPGTAPSGLGYASTLLYRRGDPVTLLAPDAGPEVVHAYREAFPGRDVLVLADGTEPPAPLAAVGLDHLDTIDVATPVWEITYDRMPTRAEEQRWRFSIWRATTP